MQEQRFKIVVGSEVMAEQMTLEAVTLFVEAFFNKYNAEDSLLILRQEEDKDDDKNW